MESSPAAQPVAVEVEKQIHSCPENAQRDFTRKDVFPYESHRSKTTEVSRGGGQREQYSKLKSLLQAPVKTPMASVASPPGSVMAPPPGAIVARAPGSIMAAPQLGSMMAQQPGSMGSPPPGFIVAQPPGSSVALSPPSTVSQPSGSIMAQQPGYTMTPPPGSIVAPPLRSIVAPSPGSIGAQPPGSTVASPSGSTVTQPPGSIMSLPPGYTVALSPGSMGTPPPGYTVAPPPGFTVTQPSGSILAQPPGSTVAPPPRSTVTQSSGSIMVPQPGYTVAPPPDSIVAPPLRSIVAPSPGFMGAQPPGSTVAPPPDSPASIGPPTPTQIMVPLSDPSGAPTPPSRSDAECAVVSPKTKKANDKWNSSHEKDGVISKQHHDRGSDDVDGSVNMQMVPLDLSCKNPYQRTVPQSNQEQSKLQQREIPQVYQEHSQKQQRERHWQTVRDNNIQNGQTMREDTRNQRSQLSPQCVAETTLSPAKSEQEPIQKPVQGSVPFDPLFILSQVACEKLSELQSTEPEVKVKGKGKSKRNKTGKKSKKSKKKDAEKTIASDNITIERIENGKPIGVPSYLENQDQNRPNGYLNQYAKYREQTSSQIDVKMIPGHYNSKGSGVQRGDYMDLDSGGEKKVTGSVNVSNQGDGKTDRSTWPYTCKTCGTRFKNAAFLKIHTKIAHENKQARVDASGNRVNFVPKDGARVPQAASGSSTPTHPFPINHWKSTSSGDPRTSGEPNQQGCTSIPCVLKVHRQTSTSEMSSSLVKMEGDIVGSEDGKFHGKFEPADIFRAAENGEFDSHHPRPKLEVDGSSYEIIKVERDTSASGSPDTKPLLSPGGSSKGFQHKFYLQISDRNQSDSSTAVKIERETTQIPLEGFDDVDDKSELKRKLFEGNPNQIRVPTSLALKFIPGDSGDPQRRDGYQHKVYLRIVDGSESSIRIKTGSMKSQSSSTIVGSTVKIESRYMHETPRHHNVHDTTRPHKCHYCPKHFPSISALTAHERIHTGEKPYECRFCGRAFYHQNDRRKHERIHTGEKPYQCSICGQKFTNKGQVKIHERNHTGERPYQCRHCHKCFKSISNVNRHEKIHTGLKPFTCPVCHRGFSRREHVRTHEEICRKKLIEDEAELADDPIGDVKLPYYRQIGVKTEVETPSPISGSPPFSDQQQQPPEKKPKVEEIDPTRYMCSPNQEFAPQANPDDDEDDDIYEAGVYRRPDEAIPLTPDGEDPNTISPLLYNSGPPVKPEEVSAIPSANMDVQQQVDSMKHTSRNTTEDSSDRTLPVTSDSQSGGYTYKPAGGDGFLPIGYDQNKPPIRMSYEPVDNRSKIPPPVLYVPGSGDRNDNDAQFASDKPPLLYVSVPTRSQTTVIQRKPDPSKLSSHIESLEPMPEQATVSAPDMAKKEPRHYVCGPQTNMTPPVIQTETTIPKETINEANNVKLAGTIPESERLSLPIIQRSTTLPVSEVYSNPAAIRQEPVSIIMKTSASTGAPVGGENPPLLCPQNIANKPPAKPALDEPPILSVIEEGPSKAVESPINAVPPLLERNDRPSPFVVGNKLKIPDTRNMPVIPSVGEGNTQTKRNDEANERHVFDRVKVTDISQPFSIGHISEQSSSNQS